MKVCTAVAKTCARAHMYIRASMATLKPQKVDLVNNLKSQCLHPNTSES